MSQCYSAIFRFSAFWFRLKLQGEIHNLHEKYHPVLCSLWDVGVKHPALRTRNMASVPLPGFAWQQMCAHVHLDVDLRKQVITLVGNLLLQLFQAGSLKRVA